MKRATVMIVGLLLMAMDGQAQCVAEMSVRELSLSNGMKVWLNEDHTQPKVFGAVVVKAGARDCPDTGIAHYFEHIMFKGTDSIGTINYASEKVFLDSIAAQYELLAETRDEQQRKQIQQQINRLSIRAGEFAIPNEFDRMVAEYGGTGLNAATSYDYTYYYNTFSPQYIRQWLTIYSHRLVHPVYRLFQGELETVYEEKNRSADNILMGVLEHGMKELFKGTPYEYPIIGSTENLKNPRMSEMEAFYKKYYVPENMGLILCGDFNTDEVIALLEPTFGQLPRGLVSYRNTTTIPPLQGQRTVGLKVPIPLVKASALAFRAPTDFEADAPALDLATRLLSNDGETGLVDSLVNNHRMMAGITQRFSLNGSGILILASIPTIPFGSKKKAEQLCWEQVEKLKRGEFSEYELDVLKLEAQREQSEALENLDSRSTMMVDVFAQGRSWEDYIRQVEAIRKLTKDDVVRVANQYFTTDYVRLVKKFGMYKKDVIEKPAFEPVRPKNADSESDYARKLRDLPTEDRPVRLIDFENDAQIVPLCPAGSGSANATSRLFVTKNPMNDVFNLTLMYHRGTLEEPVLDAVSEFVNQLGTDSLSLQTFRKALQERGAVLETAATKNYFLLNLKGFDESLLPALELLGHFMEHAKVDEKVKKKMVSELKTSRKAIWKSNDEVMAAIMEKIEFGEKSQYLTQVLPDELSRMTGEDLLRHFRNIQQYACDVIYSGSLAAEDVAKMVCQTLPISKSRVSHPMEARPLKTYEDPVVYVYDMPSARQSIIRTYQGLRPMPTADEQARLLLLCRYFGGGMSSLMFQEIREFRSMAYTTGTVNALPVFPERHPTCFSTYIGTQADKTMQALAVLDTLFNDMPMRERNLNVAKKELISSINNGYPTFRALGMAIANYLYEGRTSDPDSGLVQSVPSLTADDIVRFYQQEVKPVPRITLVVGDKRKLNLQELSRYGRVVELKRSDFFR